RCHGTALSATPGCKAARSGLAQTGRPTSKPAGCGGTARRREGNAMADETQALVQTLVERAQSGDGGAFGELYEQFAPEIYRYLLRHLNGRRESAEDLTEEVFLKVLERLGSYQFRGLPFSAWLYRIARNHMIDHLRSRPKQVVSSLDTAPQIPEKKAEQGLDPSLDPP